MKIVDYVNEILKICKMDYDSELEPISQSPKAVTYKCKVANVKPIQVLRSMLFSNQIYSDAVTDSTDYSKLVLAVNGVEVGDDIANLGITIAPDPDESSGYLISVQVISVLRYSATGEPYYVF